MEATLSRYQAVLRHQLEQATPQLSGFGHKELSVPLWLNKGHKALWLDFQLPTVDAGLNWPLETLPSTGQGQGPLSAVEDRCEVEICKRLCEDGRICDAVDALDLLVQRQCYVSNNLFYRVLKKCIQNKDLALGRRIHALTVKSGYQGDPFLATHLMGLYASHGRLEEAMGVFTKVPSPDAYNWATIILAYARHGEAAEAAKAVRLYRQMCESSTVEADDRLYSAILKACAVAKDLGAGKEVHAQILASSGMPDRFVQAGLVNMYAKCGSLDDARRLFDDLPFRDVVTWTSMIAGYTQQGMGREALDLYWSMQQEGLTRPNPVTYTCLLQACADIGQVALDEGKRLHAEINAQGLQETVSLSISLVHMYAKCRSLEDACRLFETLAERDVVTWTALIAGHVHMWV